MFLDMYFISETIFNVFLSGTKINKNCLWDKKLCTVLIRRFEHICFVLKSVSVRPVRSFFAISVLIFLGKKFCIMD